MAEYMCLVKKEKASEAERKLRMDFDVAARQSITIRDPAALGVKELNGIIFYITGSDEGVHKCKELLKEFVHEAKSELLEKAKHKIKEEEDRAAAGFGGIFG